MRYVDKQEESAQTAVEQLRRALDALDGQSPVAVRKAEVAWLEAMEELDLLQIAKKSLLGSYRGRFVKCLPCRNPLNDEGSYLAHWQYNRGRICCVSTPSILKVLGFVAERVTTASSSFVTQPDKSNNSVVRARVYVRSPHIGKSIIPSLIINPTYNNEAPLRTDITPQIGMQHTEQGAQFLFRLVAQSRKCFTAVTAHKVG
ncbi:hypothetical protein [Burkholderia pseudomallei]|uniref:hypothetical protein n=1 Tax=Burkholderia pseudomallei TaxID=28450 RepID=UPI001177BDF9|nr:hypothetical protein [Burkholderia pseudomallei]